MAKRITTYATDGLENGHVITIWNENEDNWKPSQVYATCVLPGTTKGPHLHNIRHGRFICIAGDVKVILRSPGGEYSVQCSGENHSYAQIDVPPGWAAQLVNETPSNALVVNLPSPGWTQQDPDEHPVTGWNYKDGK